MIHSMTGYASKTRDLPGGSLSLELKSVNSRFLDIHFRVCDELRMAEPALREAIAARVGRGKVECRVYYMAAARGAQQLQLNDDLLAIEGRRDQLVGKIQTRYGITEQEAEAQVSTWETRRLKDM